MPATGRWNAAVELAGKQAAGSEPAIMILEAGRGGRRD
jgi:hypothetical protein